MNSTSMLIFNQHTDKIEASILELRSSKRIERLASECCSPAVTFTPGVDVLPLPTNRDCEPSQYGSYTQKKIVILDDYL